MPTSGPVDSPLMLILLISPILFSSVLSSLVPYAYACQVGITPTLEAVKSGKYKYFNEVRLVTMGEPKGTAKRYLEFASSSEAEKILEKFGMTGVRN